MHYIRYVSLSLAVLTPRPQWSLYQTVNCLCPQCQPFGLTTPLVNHSSLIN
ncbi:hypothetical protein BaRGS_00030680, partial [Batillaria attramentaria]